MIKINYGLETHIQRDESLRAYEIVFIDPRIHFGGMVYVEDKWLRKRGLSLGGTGMVNQSIMTIFSAFWTGTTQLAGLIRYSPEPYFLINGVDIV